MQTAAHELVPGHVGSPHFDRTLSVRPVVTRTTAANTAAFEAELDESWASLRGVHGGYATALAVRAVELAVPDRAVRTVSASFLRPADVGPATPPVVRHFGQADLRLDPATAPTGDAHDARVAGHVRPLESRPFDAPWLVAIGDLFPPSPFRRNPPPVGGVSVDYTVHVHRVLPADPEMLLEGVFVAGTSTSAMALERGTLATPDGTLVAETFHTRWTA